MLFFKTLNSFLVVINSVNIPIFLFGENRKY